MEMYNGYNFGGTHFIWWFVWVMLLFWIFASPYHIPGQRSRKDWPLDMLKQRFASGSITTEEYNERKKILEGDSVK